MYQIIKIFTIISAVAFAGGVMAAQTISWTGCGITKKAFMTEMSKQYFAETGIKVKITGGGATKGIRHVASGKTDIGGSCRHKLNVSEEKNALMHHVAWDALVFIVNKKNPVTDISLDQVKGVYNGDITNWKELGGNDAPINLIVRASAISGVAYMARELIFNNPDMIFSSNAKKVKNSGRLEVAISKDPDAIGVTGISSAKKRLNVLNVLKLDGVYPGKENIAQGTYKYFRPLYLVTVAEPTNKMKSFIDFVKSEKGQAVISSEGTVNLNEGKKLETFFKGHL